LRLNIVDWAILPIQSITSVFCILSPEKDKDPIRPEKINSTLQITKLHDLPRPAHYSFRVMTLLKPDDYLPLGFAKTLVTIETLAGPVLLGFFALALRQRLRR
jgi:hypothetical protein